MPINEVIPSVKWKFPICNKFIAGIEFGVLENETLKKNSHIWIISFNVLDSLLYQPYILSLSSYLFRDRVAGMLSNASSSLISSSLISMTT